VKRFMVYFDLFSVWGGFVFCYLLWWVAAIIRYFSLLYSINGSLWVYFGLVWMVGCGPKRLNSRCVSSQISCSEALAVLYFLILASLYSFLEAHGVPPFDVVVFLEEFLEDFSLNFSVPAVVDGCNCHCIMVFMLL